MDGKTLKETTTLLEQLLGEWPNEEGTVIAWGNYIQNKVEVQRNMVEQHEEYIRGRVIDVHSEVLALKEDFGSKL